MEPNAVPMGPPYATLSGHMMSNVTSMENIPQPTSCDHMMASAMPAGTTPWPIPHDHMMPNGVPTKSSYPTSFGPMMPNLVPMEITYLPSHGHMVPHAEPMGFPRPTSHGHMMPKTVAKGTLSMTLHGHTMPQAVPVPSLSVDYCNEDVSISKLRLPPPMNLELFKTPKVEVMEEAYDCDRPRKRLKHEGTPPPAMQEMVLEVAGVTASLQHESRNILQPKKVAFHKLSRFGKENLSNCLGYGPLGLSLRKSESLLDLIQKNIMPNSELNMETEKDEKKKPNGDAFLSISEKDKLKAANFPVTQLRIGAWKCFSCYEGDLVAKCYYAKRKLVWEILQNGLKSKIEVQWSDITALKASFSGNQKSSLDIEMSRPPLFFKETNPQPRKHTSWQSSSDFTEGQGTICRCHHLEFPEGVFQRHYERLLQCDTRLKSLSEQTSPITDSSFFEPQYLQMGLHQRHFQPLISPHEIKRDDDAFIPNVASSPSSDVGMEESGNSDMEEKPVPREDVLLQAPFPLPSEYGSWVGENVVCSERQILNQISLQLLGEPYNYLAPAVIPLPHVTSTLIDEEPPVGFPDIQCLTGALDMSKANLHHPKDYPLKPDSTSLKDCYLKQVGWSHLKDYSLSQADLADSKDYLEHIVLSHLKDYCLRQPDLHHSKDYYLEQGDIHHSEYYYHMREAYWQHADDDNMKHDANLYYAKEDNTR